MWGEKPLYLKYLEKHRNSHYQWLESQLMPQFYSTTYILTVPLMTEHTQGNVGTYFDLSTWSSLYWNASAAVVKFCTALSSWTAYFWYCILTAFTESRRNTAYCVVSKGTIRLSARSHVRSAHNLATAAWFLKLSLSPWNNVLSIMHTQVAVVHLHEHGKNSWITSR